MDLITFSLACFNVLLKAPRLILAFVSLNAAFSSYFSDFPEIFSDNMSMRSVSSCVFVKWLLWAMILTMGSFVELTSHACTLSFSFKLVPCYDIPNGYGFVYWLHLKTRRFQIAGECAGRMQGFYVCPTKSELRRKYWFV